MTNLEALIEQAVAQRATAAKTGNIRDYGQANATLSKCKRAARELEATAREAMIDNILLLLS